MCQWDPLFYVCLPVAVCMHWGLCASLSLFPSLGPSLECLSPGLSACLSFPMSRSQTLDPRGSPVFIVGVSPSCFFFLTLCPLGSLSVSASMILTFSLQFCGSSTMPRVCDLRVSRCWERSPDRRECPDTWFFLLGPRPRPHPLGVRPNFSCYF